MERHSRLVFSGAITESGVQRVGLSEASAGGRRAWVPHCMPNAIVSFVSRYASGLPSMSAAAARLAGMLAASEVFGLASSERKERRMARTPLAPSS